MTEEEFHPQPENEGGQSEGEPQPKKSDEELQSQAGASLAEQQKAREAGKTAELEDRQGQIEIFIVDNDLINNEDVFGKEPLNSEVMSTAVKLLLEAENTARRIRPNYQIDKAWDKNVAKDYLERKYTGTERDIKAEDKEDKRDGYQKSVDAIREKNPNIDNLTLCSQLAQNHNADLPSEHLERIQAFVQMQQLAVTPEDAAIVTAKINAQDFSAGIPDPAVFIYNEIFSYPGYDSGVSEETQSLIAAKLGVPRPPSNKHRVRGSR